MDATRKYFDFLKKIDSYSAEETMQELCQNENWESNFDISVFGKFNLDLWPILAKSPRPAACFYKYLVNYPSARKKISENLFFNHAKKNILKDPLSTCIIACIRDDFYKEAEPVILKNGYSAYVYARDKVGIWPKAEHVIANCSEVTTPDNKSVLPAIAYAINVVKGRWAKGEATIAKYADHSYEYAKFIMRRFNAGEDAISKKPGCAFLYVRDILKKRWRKAEPAIAQHPIFAYEYARDFIKGRFEKGEDAISTNAEISYRYAVEVIGGKLPENMHNRMLSGVL